MGEVSVRVLSGADWAAWRETRLRSLQQSPAAFGSTYAREAGFTPQTWRSRLEDPRSVTLLGYDDAVPVATGAAFPDAPGLLHVVAMWVEPQHRGQRLAGALLDVIRGWAEERDLGLHLDVADTNQAARRVYLRYGFVPTGESHPLREGEPEGTQRLLLSRVTRPAP